MRNIQLNSKFLRSILLAIGLLSLAILVGIIADKSFFINKDSYNFILPNIIVKGELAEGGKEIFVQFYNRIGFISIIGVIYQFTSNIVGLIKIINIAMYILSIFLVYIISKNIYNNLYVNILISSLFAFTPMNVFSASIISNDTLAITLLLIVILLLIKKNKFTPVMTFIFSAISTLRIEYVILLLPIYFFLNNSSKSPEFKKQSFRNILLSVPASILANILLLVPHINNQWFTYQSQIIMRWGSALPILLVFALLLILIFKYKIAQVSKIVLILSLITISAALLRSTMDFELAVNFIKSTASILSIFSILIILLTSKKISWKISNTQSYLLLSAACLFIVYQSFYFQHLIVIIPLLCLFLTPYAGKLSENLNNYETLSILAIVISISLSLFIYSTDYAIYNKDFAQISAGITRKYVNSSQLEVSDLLIYTNSPEANYFWNRYASRDLIEFLDGKISTSAKNIVVTSTYKLQHTISGYNLSESREFDYQLDYETVEEGEDFTNNKIYIYLFTKE